MATQPIYWLASATNSRVTQLQQGLNVVLKKLGYLPIAVTGKLDGTTCGALVVCGGTDFDALSAAVPSDIISEATKTCSLAKSQGGLFVVPKADPNAVKPTTTTPAPVVTAPVVSAPVVTTPAPTTTTPESTPTTVPTTTVTVTDSSDNGIRPEYVQKCKDVGGTVDANMCIFGDPQDPSAAFCYLRDLYEGTCSKKVSMMPWIIGFGVVGVAAGTYLYVKNKRRG